jgi:hypothetical protein
MPWKCPACSTQIQHSDLEPKPLLHTRYRCHVCRLELIVDPQRQKLIVVPLAFDENERRILTDSR